MVLLVSSALDVQLGLPTFIAGVATAIAGAGTGPSAGLWQCSESVSWGVLPLVAGLFVLVDALQKTGVTDELADAVA